MLLCGNGGVTLAERQIPSGLAALLVATEPLWLVVLAWIKPAGTAPTFRQVVGLIAGFGGVSILVGGGALPANSGHIEGLGIPALLVLGAALCWAAGSIYATDSPAAPAKVNNGIVMMCGGVFLLFSGLLHGEAAQLRLQSISGLSILALVYLTLAGSLAAFSAYTYLLSSTTPAMASTYAFVNPVVAVLLGWSFAGEPITSRSLLAMCAIVAAVILLTLKKREPKKQDQRARPRMDSRARLHVRAGCRRMV
jgi:drug/metabolite transporter (DMT)-like permease